MALYMIGIGLYDKDDITVRGLEAVKKCDKIYLEYYTSQMVSDPKELEKVYGKEVIVADRNLVESEAEKTILKDAKEGNSAFLVIGDVFGATTHTDLFLRAKNDGIDVHYIPNASIMNVIGVVGLELYKYGKTTSITFPTGSFMPRTPYEVIKMNRDSGLHTLCLLDIKMSEPSIENLKAGVDKPEPPKFMTIKEALKVLLTVENKLGENIIDHNTLVIGCARLGSDEYVIKAGPVFKIEKEDFGAPLHCLIVPGNMHFVEEDAIKEWSIDKE